MLQVIDLISALFQRFIRKDIATHLQQIKKRKSPSKRKLLAVSCPPPRKRARNIKRDRSDNLNSALMLSNTGIIFTKLKKNFIIIKLNSKVIDLKKKLHKKPKKLEKLISELERMKQFSTFIQPIER